ncbi:MAG: RNA-binding S4 domain-containing protein [Betaproteobacteria bacterium]|nr:RNA-binding S4 domain-containing protein [Betaproteobacteria bacterium]
MRIDKWLWAARFYKTRSLAQQAVEAGRVKLNGERVKPAKELRVGDTLDLRIATQDWTINIRALSDKRGPAAVAQTLYEETEESRARRIAQLLMRKLSVEPAHDRQGHGRPTKRERRQLERWRGE